MKELKQAFIYVTIVVLLFEVCFEFVWKHKAFFSGVLVTCLAGVIIYSIKRANSNAKQ
jgi:hypothetical protein